MFYLQKNVIPLTILLFLIIGLLVYFVFMPLMRPQSIADPDATRLTEEATEETTEESLFDAGRIDEMSFTEAISRLDKPEHLLAYLNYHFRRITRDADVSYSPEEFFNKQQGAEEDFAVFLAYIIRRQNNEAIVFRYKTDDNQIHSLTVFRKDKPQYIGFDNNRLKLFEAGNSFDDLIKLEEERLNVRIIKFQTFEAAEIIDFSAGTWLDRK